MINTDEHEKDDLHRIVKKLVQALFDERAEVKRLRERYDSFMEWMLENYDEIVNEWEASE
jgi:hypothetical protein